jgi:hypothetical protein
LLGAQVTNDTHRGVRMYEWAKNNRHLLYMQDKDGDENFHIYAVRPTLPAGVSSALACSREPRGACVGDAAAPPALAGQVDLDAGVVRDMTPFEGIRAQNLFLNKRFPDRFLVRPTASPPALSCWRLRARAVHSVKCPPPCRPPPQVGLNVRDRSVFDMHSVPRARRPPPAAARRARRRKPPAGGTPAPRDGRALRRWTWPRAP